MLLEKSADVHGDIGKAEKRGPPPTCRLTLHFKRIADTFYAPCIRLSGYGLCIFTENMSFVLTPMLGDHHAEQGAPHSDTILHVLCSRFVF
jgi:hypothetical protein